MILTTLIALYLSIQLNQPKTSVMRVYERTEHAVEAPQESIEQIIERVGQESRLSQQEIVWFKKIAWCESRYNPRAVSRTKDEGLYQINSRWWKFDKERVFDAEYNTWYAMNVVYKRQGKNAWVCNGIVQ